MTAATIRVTGAIHELPSLPRDLQGPVFNEPWEAHAFALAVRLSETGFYSWREWTAFLTQEIQSAQQQGDPDLGTTYYHHWLSALEKLCAAKGLVESTAMTRRKEQWRQAYLHTPHGQAVELPATNARGGHSPGSGLYS
jgi:nitrile hydratase accessory protein